MPHLRPLAAAALLLVACAPAPAHPQGTGVPAAQIALVGLDGARHQLSDYLGRVVVVNFWATWCIPCRAEIPDLEHEFRAHPTELVVLGIDYQESRADVAEFATEIGISYPVLLDEAGAAHDAYRVGGLPQTVVVDRSGRVAGSWIGIASRAKMEAELQAALRR